MAIDDNNDNEFEEEETEEGEETTEGEGEAAGGAGEGGDVSDVSPAEVQEYLEGVDYPVDKDTLIEHARSKEAPDVVLTALDQLPEREFNSPVDINKELAQFL